MTRPTSLRSNQRTRASWPEHHGPSLRRRRADPRHPPGSRVMMNSAPPPAGQRCTENWRPSAVARNGQGSRSAHRARTPPSVASPRALGLDRVAPIRCPVRASNDRDRRPPRTELAPAAASLMIGDGGAFGRALTRSRRMDDPVQPSGRALRQTSSYRPVTRIHGQLQRVRPDGGSRATSCFSVETWPSRSSARSGTVSPGNSARPSAEPSG